MSTLTDLPAYPAARSGACPFDPPAAYADWRAAQGLQRVRLWNGATAWVVTRYEDIKAALSDPRISADATRPGFPWLTAGGPGSLLAKSFLRMDDPEHARLRRMVVKDFTAKRVRELTPRIQRLTDELLDRMARGPQPADLVAEFALPLPSLVICLLLGVPYEDHEFFQENSRRTITVTATAEESQAASAALHDYLRDLVVRLEREPGDGLIGRLVTERVRTGELTREDVIRTALLLLFGGHETTGNMIALGTLALLRHPDQLSRIRDTEDPDVIAAAVEELLRYLSVVENSVARVAVADLTLGGRHVRAGEGLFMSLPAGNRDAACTPLPDTLDTARDARDHLAFGYGSHQCLGQLLARAELTVALPALLRRLPGLRLAVPVEEVPFRLDTLIFGTYRLPVAW
ncbi:cytochrome P450 [Streptomyces sclerotialus]|uniref:cytochrome P450 n=1 Tax=Streptomyces sclerotialus TaxID=1957 RepID=UPI0004C6F562